MENLVGFRAKKAAQIAAHYIKRAGNEIDKLKLIKLLYLTERESVEVRGRPMLYDEYYSLKDGPICSNSLNGLNHQADDSVWRDYVGVDGAQRRFLPRELTEADEDQFSKSDRKVMEAVWQKFGHMTSSQVRNWTHLHCEEYTEISSGRLPIDLRDMAAAVGVENPDEVVRHMSEYRSIEAAVAETAEG